MITTSQNIFKKFNNNDNNDENKSNNNVLHILNLANSSKTNLKLETSITPFQSNKNIHLNTKRQNTKYNNTQLSNKKILFLKIKKLITEFEKENDTKKLLKTKNSKKKQKINYIHKNNNTQSPSSLSHITNKKIFYNVPKIKSQMQFNRYLINDFKENDSEADYIKRSKKYQKINEDFDELILMKQIKEVAKNGIFENIIEENNNRNVIFIESPESEKKSNKSIKSYMSKNVSEFGAKNKNYNNRNLYNSSNMRRFYTEKIKEIPKNLGNSYNKRGSANSNNINNINQSIININKIKEKENEKKKEKEKEKESNDENNSANKSTGIKYLIDMKNKINNSNTNTESNLQRRITKRKKKTLSLDKFSFSNKLYNIQKKEYKHYMKKKQYMRGKNFSKQIALINKEKEKFGVIETDNNDENEGGLPKLKIANLLFQIQYKDIFKNSFNTLRVFEEGDQDLDLDDLNKIKNSIRDYEIEMIKVLKKNKNLNYIKNIFNKKTIGKFQSTKGIYFGS